MDWPDLPCGLLAFDDGGRLLSVNRRLSDWLQLSPREEAGPLLNDLLTPASRQICVEAVFGSLQRSGHVDDVLLVFQGHDGREWPAQVSVARQQRADAVVNVAVVVRVASWRHDGQAVVGARPTAEQLPGLVYQYMRRPDGSTCFPYASEAIHDLFGITPEEARHSAEALALRVHRDDWPVVFESIQESARTLGRWDSCFRVDVNGEMRWLEGSSSPQALPDGSVLWHGYLSDVTDRKALEQSRQGEAVAEQASRAKSEFLARISHELRTPLNAVLGFSQLLSADRGHGLRPHQQRQLDHIESAGRSLLALVNEVLDLTHIESGRMEMKLEALDLLPVVEESLAMVALLAERSGVMLRTQVDPALQAVADRSKLVQCIVNLLTNAIKYNREGGQVAVVGAKSTRSHQVRIDVRDTGAGLTASQMAHLFEPFNRLGAELGSTEGSGLGLVIVRGLAERQGGRLTVDSEPGQGTCFSLHLEAPGEQAPDTPAHQEEPAAADLTAPPAQEGAPRRVLYVEDNAVNVMLMQAIFDLRPSLLLETACTGAEGLAKALADPPALLLLDLGLPDVDGVTLLRRLRDHEELQGIQAVAVSADALSPDIERALSAGFDAYWTKPLDLRVTLAALDALTT